MIPDLRPHVELLACAGIVLLCLLNIIGIRESASVALAFAGASLLANVAGSWLAFSGLESISQLSPALKLPTRTTVRYAMWEVVGTVEITSPTLTALSIAVIPDSMKSAAIDSFISDLALVRSGPLMQISVVAAASARS